MFAVSQAALEDALPPGVNLQLVPNSFGALLEPSIFRDSKISCMYLVEDVKKMLVPSDDVPLYEKPIIVPETVDQSMMVTPKKPHKMYKSERKSDFASGAYLSSIKKVRTMKVEYPIAKENAKKLLGEDEDEGEEVEHTIERVETRYVLKCLITSCTSSSMFEALDYYPSALINSILQVDLKYRGVEVLKNKANLLLVCESFLIGFNLTLI